MQKRKWICLTASLLGAIALGIVSYSYLAAIDAGQADQPIVPVGGIAGKAAEPLPIKQVVLFNTGVGYFQREGEVDGDTRLHLSFAVSDINDLLMSLVLQDSRGHIGTVNYDSSDPIDKILRSFALDLTGNPTFGQLLNQARGEKIEIVRTEKKGDATKIAGAIIGMEVHKKAVGKDQTVDSEILNLNTAAGIQAIPMDQIVTVRFLNPLLESEFQRALNVLASSHDTQKKSVSIGFNGEGKRQVRVGYVVERPIWKTTYRLRIDDNNQISLQGWALVENTSDDDWNDVKMFLVSGKPISFRMNLYDPIYIPRPFVEPELFASLRPPVYAGSMALEQKELTYLGVSGNQLRSTVQGNGVPGFNFNNPVASVPPAAPIATGATVGSYALDGAPGAAGHASMPLAGTFNSTLALAPTAPPPQGNDSRNHYLAGAAIGGGAGPSQQQNLNQPAQNYQERAFKDQNKLTYEELQRRRAEQQVLQREAKQVGGALTGFNFKEGVQSVASADEVGDYYQYAIDQKITLPRQKSAMLPILDQTVEGLKVSIYNEATNAKYPLLGLKLKNTSGQPLTQGPITVYDGGVFGGDTRIFDVQPNEVRLLSYALDQGTEVKTEIKQTPSPDMIFRIGSDQFSARYFLRETKTYTIRNRSTHDRVMILEHPIKADWKLFEPKKPAEQTRDLYRFQVSAPAGKTTTYEVVEDLPRVDNHPGSQPAYAIASGINVKVATTVDLNRLIGLKINKGFVVPTFKTRETKAYCIQNLSDMDRCFTIDHVVRPGWTRLDANDNPVKGPQVVRVKLDIAKGKTGDTAVREERTHTDGGQLLKNLNETQIKLYMNNPSASAAVKAAFTTALGMQAKIADTQGQIEAVQRELTVVTTDNARVRENLKIIPQDSEFYKPMLEKFVNQDKQIETQQNQVRTLTATLQTQMRDYDLFLSKLDAD